MNQTLEVIRALDDSMERSMTYKNRNWLYENVVKLNITIKSIEEIQLYFFELYEKANKEGSIIVQNGTRLEIKRTNPFYETLILEKNLEGDGYFVFLYSPAIHNPKFQKE